MSPFESSPGRDVETCLSLRAGEIEAVESIYPECISKRTGSTLGEIIIDLELFIDLEREYEVHVVDDGSLHQRTGHSGNSISSRGPSSSQDHRINVTASVGQPTRFQVLSHLPPIHITLLLPPSYPLYDPPIISSILAQNSWLVDPLISKIKSRILDLWDECRLNEEGILSRLFELTTQNCSILQDLGLVDSSQRQTQDIIRIPHSSPRLLAPLLKSFNTFADSKHFNEESFPCPICLTTLKGVRCMRLQSCGHVSCRSCLTEFWEMSITQGDVSRVGCVDEECVKRAAETNDVLWSSVEEDEVRLIVGEELTLRWKRLRQKRLVEKDPTVIICPLSICQAPVFRPSLVSDQEDDDVGWNRLRTCQACEYSFCALCQRTWHGPISGCEKSITAALIETYLKFDPDSAGRKDLERRYGKSYMNRSTTQYREAKLNKQWMDRRTMVCPGCRVVVEKSAGCNHMTCTRCTMHFCFLCGLKLKAENPYLHFSDKRSACYSRLFDVDQGEEE